MNDKKNLNVISFTCFWYDMTIKKKRSTLWGTLLPVSLLLKKI